MNRFKFCFASLIVLLSSMSFGQTILKNGEFIPALEHDHGGRNGGDGLEIQIELMAQKISAFVASGKGQSIFPEINVNYLASVTEQASFNITSEPLVDKYGSSRTCTNEPKKMEIICNVDRLSLITDAKVHYILVFHEILGLMNLELGYNQDVSMYPISFKLVNHIADVENASLEVSNRPEFSSVKSKSRGAEIVSQKTGEKIRLICLDSVEVHKCKKFSYVRTFEEKQAPLIEGIESLSQKDLEKIHSNLQDFKRKASVGKYELGLISYAQDVNNFKGSMSLMGQKITLKEKEFTNLENLILLSIKNTQK